jgi:peptide/nickel transport system substrate-binding protein
MPLNPRLRRALLAGCMTLALAAPALAQKSADTLRITSYALG